MLTGLLIRESLKDQMVLSQLHITRTEIWEADNAGPEQPSKWTAITFTAEEESIPALTGALSDALKPRGWFINASTRVDVHVIFPGKVFRYRKGDRLQREAAREHGRSLGIPEDQLDWSE